MSVLLSLKCHLQTWSQDLPQDETYAVLAASPLHSKEVPSMHAKYNMRCAPAFRLPILTARLRVAPSRRPLPHPGAPTLAPSSIFQSPFLPLPLRPHTLAPFTFTSSRLAPSHAPPHALAPRAIGPRPSRLAPSPRSLAPRPRFARALRHPHPSPPRPASPPHRPCAPSA